MPGPAKLSENTKIPRRSPNLGDDFYFAAPGTGLGGVNQLSALLSLLGSVAPVTTFADIDELLANTTIQLNYFAFVIDASDDVGAPGWGLYFYKGPDRDDINSYQLTIYESGLAGLAPGLSTVLATSNDGGGTYSIKNILNAVDPQDLTTLSQVIALLGTIGTPNLDAVLTVGTSAGLHKITSLSPGTVAGDAVELSQMNAAIAAAVTGLLDYRGGFDASGGSWPNASNGGSGSSGTVLKGDVWVVTVAGTLPGMTKAVNVGDWLAAKVDTPGNTAANWTVVDNTVVLATDTVAGIMKLYQATGANIDGAISQAIVTNALNLKSNRQWTVSPKTGSFTMTATELALINTGTALVMEGDGTGDLTIPPNSSVAFSVGDTFAVRGFLNIVAGAGVLVTGTNGTLVVGLNRTSIIEKTATNTWLLHNGSAVVSLWSTGEAGVVEESLQAEAELIITGANTGTTGGLSQTRTPSEIGLYYMIRKMLTLAWTWAIGPTITDATASTPAWFNASKKLVSGAAIDLLDYVGASPVSVPVALVSTTITLDFASKYERKFYTSVAHSANFTLTKINKTLMEYGHYVFPVTGTIYVQLDSDDRMPDDTQGWNYASKQLMLVSGGTGLLYSLGYTKIGSVYHVTVSTRATV